MKRDAQPPLGTAPRGAVIVIGSNSTRMLTANLDRRLSMPLRGRVETRLFLSLGKEGLLAPEGIQGVRQAVSALCRQAQAAGATHTRVYATSATRDANNRDALIKGILDDCGLPLLVLSGQEEAAASFVGAARVYPGNERLGVMDIGGGSSEIALGQGQRLQARHSLQLGAARLFQSHPVQSAQSLAPALSHATAVIQEAGLPPLVPPARFLLVGGTGTALMGLLRGQLLLADEAEDLPFTRQQASQALHALAALSPLQRAALPGMTPGREHLLPAGLVVLLALMEELRLQVMWVTTRNNTDGLLYEQALAVSQPPS